MSKPEHIRSSSANLTANGSRPLEGKLAIVTGSSRGIGAATCEHLARKGASLIMNYNSSVSEERTNKLAKQLETNHGIRTTVVQADLGSDNGPAHIVEIAKNQFAHPKTGKFQLDIIINNAAVAPANRKIQYCDAEDFAFQYNVNVKGPLLLMKAALPYLPNDRSGRIVNVSSVSSSLGLIGQSVYGGTKAALEAMTRTWARELAERATVNAINPGPVATEMYDNSSEEFTTSLKPFIQNTPLMAPREGIDSPKIIEETKKTGGRSAHVWEIADVIGMLCMPECGWSTGGVVGANGGMTFSL